MLRTLAVLAVIGSSPAYANLMTFDALPNEGGKLLTWTEDGITATGGYLAYYRTPGAAHLDGGQTSFARGIDFVTGSVFIVESLAIKPSGAMYCAAPCSPIHFDDPFPYISIKGFLDGVLVNTIELYRSESAVAELISLTFFGPLDLLTVGVNNARPGGARCANEGCGHFNIDSVLLTPISPESVPEPATLLLLSSALAGLALTKKRRLGIHQGAR